MKIAGLDVGSTATKIVVLNEDRFILEAQVVATTFDPLRQCSQLISLTKPDLIMATGYGRHLLREKMGTEVVSEIIAHAAGAHWVYPDAKVVLDIGGQDIKCSFLSPGGRVLKFEMNDRCAAGTGKFIEIMARAFGMELEDFPIFAMQASEPAKISSMCTVFAESEAISLIARGEDPARIALGLHLAVAARAAGMVKRVADQGPLVLTGGIALNPCIRKLLAEELNWEILVPSNPQLVGALGAALLCVDGGGLRRL